jgi:hypothetical protein
MSKFFSLKSLYYQYCLIIVLILINPNLLGFIGSQYFLFTSIAFYSLIIYFLVLVYCIFKQLLYVSRLSDSENKFVKNPLLPFLCSFPITVIIFNPLTLFQIGNTFKSKLSNPKIFNQLSLLNLILAIGYFVFTVVTTVLFVVAGKYYDLGVFIQIFSLILTFLPMYLTGVLVFAAERKNINDELNH